MKVLEKQQLKRIEWVDIFKALAIISVVVGHITGMYNMYIYQFHMAGFFFISGYTTNLGKRTFWETIKQKIYTIIVPMITVFVLFIALLKFLSYLYPTCNFNYPFQMNYPIKFLISEFLKGNFYISWMGAAWFLIALFGAVILAKFFHMCVYENNLQVPIPKGIFFAIISILFFYIGYYFAINYKYQVSYLDLILIAQIYFCTGILAKQYKIFQYEIFSSSYNLIVFLISLFILFYFGNFSSVTVDYPSRNFKNMVLEYLAAVNGVIFLYIVSMYLSKMFSKFKIILIKIGENTLPIVFFHFLFFKLSFFLLGIDISTNFIPPQEYGKNYLPLFLLIAVGGSIGIWQLLLKIKRLRMLLGTINDDK